MYLRNRHIVAIWSVLLAVCSAMPGAALAQQPPAENVTFSEVWQRADMPVAQGRVQRSWLWGPQAFSTRSEPLAESPGGVRQVQYYDKARMEINDPSADRSSPWYVTNGLLVTEMISGRMQIGVNSFERREPSTIPVAGDVTMTAGPAMTTPSYKVLAGVASLAPGQNQAQSKVGRQVVERLQGDGTLNPLPVNVGPDSPKYQHFDPTSRHNIPDVFWVFMNQRGTVYESGQYRQGVVFNWLTAMGYPLTEPYWIEITIGGKKSLVLMQAFERRVLTYNPANAPQWRVEMGNVGLQYFQWRYGTAAPPKDPSMLSTRPVEMPEFFRSGQYSAIKVPLYTALADERSWSDLWIRHTAELDAVTRVPPVDFKSEFVVAAFWGDKPDGCYSLRIESVSLRQRTLEVVVNRVHRGGGCTMAIVQPNDLVIVPRTGIAAGSLSVLFREPGGAQIATGTVSLP